MKQLLVSIFLLHIALATLAAKVKLPQLISDGMVLQRHSNIKIWGWADPGEEIELRFLHTDLKTTTLENGTWEIRMPKFQAGGPYDMYINEQIIRNIYIGEVWLCAGQSNMEIPMKRVRTKYPELIQFAHNPEIRYIKIGQNFDFNQEKEDIVGGQWVSATQEYINEISAVAFFFADSLYQKYRIPIGIINNAVGGSPAQAWLSETTLKTNFPNYFNEAISWRNQNRIDSIRKIEQEKSNKWQKELNRNDLGTRYNWHMPEINDSDWDDLQVPGSWEGKNNSFDGVVWCRRSFYVPDSLAQYEKAFLNLGRVKDANETYINGVKVGSVGYQYPPLWYDVNQGVLKKGKNSLVVRITNTSGKGKFFEDKPYYIEIDGVRIPLSGIWKYKKGYQMQNSAPSQTFIRWKPMCLYNGMTSPLRKYKIKGILWYQGESNVSKPEEYNHLLSELISCWRQTFDQMDMPFIIVQLANYQEAADFQKNSHWAEMRYQQLKTLSVPNTEMAVIIDVGEHNDIHPLNKKTVGHRLALAAMKLAYHEDHIILSPLIERVKVKNNKIIVTFTNSGKGLKTIDNLPLTGFYVADESNNFRKVIGEIKKEKIIFKIDKGSNPKELRYAWADNPTHANLSNSVNLPASPFRINLK